MQIAVWPDSAWSLVAARYSGASRTWSSAVMLSTPSRKAYYSRVAINDSGNALAVWSEADSLNPGQAELWFARYAPTTNTWTERALLATNGSQPDVALDSAGNAIAVWLEPEPSNTIRTARYDANAGTWTPSIELGRSRFGARMVLDDFGNATVVWQQNGLRAAKFQATTKAWATTTDLANGSYNASVAVDGSGTVIVVYQAVGGLYAVWSEAQGLTWTTPVHVSHPGVSGLGRHRGGHGRRRQCRGSMG